uniref:Speckle-type POZ protein-like protein n=1 Tax=Lygus hesperus TaxID=30085 RepID=A0A0A9ZD56_LYGHE
MSNFNFPLPNPNNQGLFQSSFSFPPLQPFPTPPRPLGLSDHSNSDKRKLPVASDKKEPATEDKKDGSPKISSTQAILQGFYNMMKNKEYTDFTIIVENKRFEVHRMFLALRSPYFAAMFTTPMKESIEKEAIEKDVDKEVFELLLEYIYTDDVKTIDDHAEKLIICADRYELNDLIELCEQSLLKTLNVSNAARYLVCVDMVRKDLLKQKIISFIGDNLKLVVNESEGWSEVSKNFDLVTTVLKQVLAEKKPTSMLNVSIGRPVDFGLISIRGIDWSIPYDVVTGACPDISSPEFRVELNGQMTTWKLHCQLYYQDGLFTNNGNQLIRIIIKYTGLLLPSPCVCKWSAYQHPSTKIEGKSVLMSWNSGKWEHILANGIKTGSVLPNRNSAFCNSSPFVISVELQSPITEGEPAEHVLAAFLRTKKHLDAKIVVEEETFEAHKVVLSEQSEVFAEKFETNLPEYKLDDISPAVFKELLCLMYMTRETPGADSVLLKVLPAAKKYKLRDTLINKCESNLIEKLQIFNAASLLAHAHEVEAQRLKSAAIKIIAENISMVISSEGWKSLKQQPPLVAEIIKVVYQLF